jgi:rhodanese-related sulfurtransferase
MNARVELPPAREVCPTTTRRLLGEGALLVDVRERSEVERVAFGVPGVVVLPLSEFERRFVELPRNRPLVLACESGPRSLKATYFLMYQGYAQVANMDGGILKWACKGFPITGDIAQATACASGAPVAMQPAARAAPRRLLPPQVAVVAELRTPFGSAAVLRVPSANDARSAGG